MNGGPLVRAGSCHTQGKCGLCGVGNPPPAVPKSSRNKFLFHNCVPEDGSIPATILGVDSEMSCMAAGGTQYAFVTCGVADDYWQEMNANDHACASLVQGNLKNRFPGFPNVNNTADWLTFAGRKIYCKCPPPGHAGEAGGGNIPGILDLSNKNITEVPVNAFEGIPFLTKLSLRENKLSTLPFGVFSNLSSLRSLVCLREFESERVGVLLLPPTSALMFTCLAYLILFMIFDKRALVF
jgi:hypothetical protein